MNKIKLTYRHLNHTHLGSTIEQFARERQFPPKVAYQFLKIAQAVRREITTAKELFTKLLKTWTVLDEAGEPAMRYAADDTAKKKPIAPYYFETPEKEESYKKALEEFLSIEFEIGQTPIPVSVLASQTVTASELEDLEPILDGLEDGAFAPSKIALAR